VSGTTLLAKIKAFFGRSPPASAPPETEVTVTPLVVPAEVAPENPPEPLFTVAEPTLAEVGVVVAEEPPAVVAEGPTPVEEAATELEPVPADGLTLRLDTERATRSTFHVTKSGATIGRGPESTIQLADLSVSRKHARITYKQGAYWLSDLGSMGGTWIDGTKLAAPRRVATGQTIDIGLCRLVVVAAAEGEKTGAAKGPSNAA